ncbi:DUF2852 domain-containing protein [Arenibaculum pallidiluteum]|uniref:DUF2852 domain-containing protein n=1 Tax=Arenibaculum pallidiluteum TaxID=2812559 RepID=UPI001A96147B|nr:DUF2852 domain-containing protein [Arenibaculum pallidiluteum]
MELAARLDEIGKPAWIGLMILGFAVFWPVGLAILAYLIWSGRMGCWKRGRWGNGWRHSAHGWSSHGRSSGNRAFDEYREQTLRRLEDEQREFREFLDRLRFARDKAEFDEFLAERRRRSEGPESGPEPQPQG